MVLTRRVEAVSECVHAFRHRCISLVLHQCALIRWEVLYACEFSWSSELAFGASGADGAVCYGLMGKHGNGDDH